MLSKSLIQFSVDGQVCVPSLFFDRRPKYGGGNKDNGNLLQKVPCTHCGTQSPLPCSRPLLTHASTRDSWTLTGNSGSVSCGVPAPSSRVLVHRSFCLCAPSLFPQSCVSSGGSMLGLVATSSRRACHIQVYCTQSPCPCSSPLLTHTSLGDTQTQFCLSLCEVSES